MICLCYNYTCVVRTGIHIGQAPNRVCVSVNEDDFKVADVQFGSRTVKYSSYLNFVNFLQVCRQAQFDYDVRESIS